MDSGSGGNGQLYSSADSVAEYSSAGQFSDRIFNTAMAFQTGKDLQRAQLMLTFPSGSYLKENENVHCSITVKTAYSKQYCAFHSASISLRNHNHHHRYFACGSSLRIAGVTVLKFSPHKIEGFGSRLKKEGRKTWTLKGQARDKNLAKSLLDQEFCKGNIKEFVELIALLFST